MPLWAATIAAQIDSPRPAPPVLRDREASPRAKRSKTTGRNCSGIPGPVSVIDTRHVLGGACTTEETFPGYKVSTAAYVNSLFSPEIIAES